MPDPWQDYREDMARRRREHDQQQPAWKRTPYDDTAPAGPGQTEYLDEP
jgi:hypothetical protein